jgi:uncharacterized protein YdhG (YjbR/CyaY superfamily)
MEKNIKKLKNIDDYISGYSPEIQIKLEEIRQTIKKVLPEAKERISYNMPSFRFHGNLIYYGAFKDHIGFYPASMTVFEEFKDELKIYKQSGKGTIQFPYNKPIPTNLIKQIIMLRAKQNIEKKAV